MPIVELQAPDGSIHQFEAPEGVRGQPWTMERASQVLPMLGREALQGGTFGAADEMGAVAAGGYSKLTGGDFQPAYDKELASENQDIRNDNTNYPTSSILANLAGGVAGARAIPQVGAMQATTRLGAVGRSALQGVGLGAVAGAASADPTVGESRAKGAEGGAVVGGLTGGALGAVLPKTAPVTNLSDEFKNGLLEANPADMRSNTGTKLGERLIQEAQGAKQATNIAYDAAGKARASVAPNSANELADAIEGSISNFDPEIVPAVRSISKYTKELRDIANTDIGKKANIGVTADGAIPTQSSTGAVKGDLTGVKYDALEGLRKRLNSIPYTQENAAAKTAALKSFDGYVGGLLEKGLIQGDDTALALIKEARAKNTYYMQNFGSKQANAAIKKYIETNGENLSPQDFADMFTRANKAGFKNAKAVKDIIGPEAMPMLREGMLGNIRQAALDAESNINPKKLATSLNNYLGKNSDLAKEVFSPSELKQLEAVKNTSSRMSGPKGLMGSFAGKLPILGEIIKERQASGVVKKLAKPVAEVKYHTPLSAPSAYGFGG